MSLTGPQVLHALDEALADIRREEDEILRKLGRSAERIAKILESEAEILLHYAAERVPAGQLAPLTAAIEAQAAAAHEALRQRTAEFAGGAERIAALDAEQSAIATRRAAALRDIDHQQASLRGLSSYIAATIARDPRYDQQKQLASQLREVAAAARSKARQAEIDRERDGRAYRGDPLFAYLDRSGFGTSGYRQKGLIAKLDGRLARLIGFETAERHYRLLDELPGLLHTHADQQAARAVAADEAIDEIERAAIDAAGGSAARAALAHAQAEIAAFDRRLAELQVQRDAATAAQTTLVTADDKALERVLADLIDALGIPEPPTEDAAMLQLADARQRISEERGDNHDHLARLKTLAIRRHELEDIEAEFKALKYDDPRSLFRDEGLTAHELNNFLTGATPTDAYWNAIRRSQAWSVGTSDWGGGVGLPRRGRVSAEAPPVRDAPPEGRSRIEPADST